MSNLILILYSHIFLSALFSAAWRSLNLFVMTKDIWRVSWADCVISPKPANRLRASWRRLAPSWPRRIWQLMTSLRTSRPHSRKRIFHLSHLKNCSDRKWFKDMTLALSTNWLRTSWKAIRNHHLSRIMLKAPLLSSRPFVHHRIRNRSQNPNKILTS